MKRNKKNEDRAAKKAKKEREKAENKRKRAEDKAAKSAEKANAKKLRENARKKVETNSLRLLSQSSTPNDGSETNTLAVANPSDGNNNLTPAPPINMLLQNEGVLNNLTPAPPTNTLLQNEGVVNNLTPAPPKRQLRFQSLCWWISEILAQVNLFFLMIHLKRVVSSASVQKFYMHSR